ncbi:MAG: hypothetical protein AAFR59_04240 [Bacteroidota bacterium]
MDPVVYYSLDLLIPMMPLRLLLLTFFLLASTYSQAQSLFDETEVLRIQMRTDIPALLADRGDSVSYHRATLTYEDAKVGSQINLDVKIRARGNFRRQPFVCEFPPLRVRFSKKDRAGTMFQKYKKLKLVCHCQGDELIMQEYLIYKVYQTLSPYGLRVRLAEITYDDQTREKYPEKHYAFFIEDVEDMADRMGGVEVKTPPTDLDSLNRYHMGMVYMFQYFIGNRDWDLAIGKNFKFIRISQEEGVIPVPYDFDWSEVVNAPYTGLPEDYESRKMREICRSEEEYQKILESYRNAEETIQLLYKETKGISGREKKRVLNFYQEFFDVINDPAYTASWFESGCK